MFVVQFFVSTHVGGTHAPSEARGAGQSHRQEVHGRVPLLHQLGRRGVHLGSGEVVDGEAVHDLPALVLLGRRRPLVRRYNNPVLLFIWELG